MLRPIALLSLVLTLPAWAIEPVRTSAELVAAFRDGKPGSTVEIGEGTFELAAALEPKTGMTLNGAGMDKTILVPAAGWTPSTKTLPDPEISTKGLDTSAYLIHLPDKGTGITVANLTLRGPQLHGAIFAQGNRDLHLHHLRIDNFLWAGIRTFSLSGGNIHDCEFIDAAGRWKRGGVPGVDGGITGGAIFSTWMSDTEIHDNRFLRSQAVQGKKERSCFGIKARQAKRCRIHHNTINVNFAIEFPFENDEDVEIDHNVLAGTISIPKHAGGPVPKSGRTFYIHHNWITVSYAIEFVRNGVEISQNLFDFDVRKDGGNLISAFGDAPAKGPASFHDNLVSNPGRGVIWIKEPFNNLDIHHNHIIARTTATPRKDGLFGFNPKSDFKTIAIHDNIIECRDQARPLLRNPQSAAAAISNNILTNVSDTAAYINAKTANAAGPAEPLRFRCGAGEEVTVDGWTASKPTQ